MISFAEAREIGEVLGRTASIREKAPSPENVILAQSAGGILKLVAGADTRTVIASVGPSEVGVAVPLPARDVLQMFKTLKGKGTAELSLDGQGLLVSTGSGGSLRIGPADGPAPKFLRPVPPETEWTAEVRLGPGVVERMAAIVGIMTNAVPLVLEYVEWTSHKGGRFMATDNMYAAAFGPFEHTSVGGAHHLEKTYLHALRGLDGEALMRFLPGPAKQVARVQTTIGRYHFIGVQLPGAPRLPAMPAATTDVSIRTNRLALVGLLRSLGGASPMVALRSDGQTATVLAANGGEGSLVADVDGVGVVRFSPSALNKALNVVKGDSVTVTYLSGAASPIRVVGDDAGWPILMAPAIVPR